MDTRRPTLAVIFQNGHASQSADRPEEDNYVNTTGRTVDKPREKKSCLNHLLIIVVSWGILLLIMVPRIYLTHVLSKNIAWLTMENQLLEADGSYLKEQILNWKEGSVARAQAIVDAYCSGRERRCNPCEEGWQFVGSSCYQMNYYSRKGFRKTWEGAREECRGRGSDLPQFDDPYFSRLIFRLRQGTAWTDLKVENGQWKRANGSYLRDHSSVAPPLDGLCMTVKGFADWEPRNCSDLEEWWLYIRALNNNTTGYFSPMCNTRAQCQTGANAPAPQLTSHQPLERAHPRRFVNRSNREQWSPWQPCSQGFSWKQNLTNHEGIAMEEK